jgi:hypothetical protein
MVEGDCFHGKNCSPGCWTVYTSQPNIDAKEFKMLPLADAPPVAIIRFGGEGMPNLSE